VVATYHTLFEEYLHHYVPFLGYFDRGGELQDCYSAADIFVFSSLTETQGLVLLELSALYASLAPAAPL
jgi:glycosyltransferase involved in cell wall biosynthesis